MNPAAAKSARMDGVASGGRRCRVQIDVAPGRQNPGSAWMVRVMSAALMFPNTPHTSTRSAGTSSRVPAAQRRITLDDPHPVGHPGGRGPVPGEGDQGRIELDQERRDVRRPWMGRHDVDHVSPLPGAQAHDPDGA